MSSQEPRKICNRDIPVLSSVMYTMQDVCVLERRIEWQYERLYGRAARITGMPGGRGVPSGFDATFARISELGEEYKTQMQRYMSELKTVERILGGIASRTMRTFVTMLYVDALPAAAIRKELNMSEWSFNKARAAVEDAPDMQSVVWKEKYVVADENT